MAEGEYVSSTTLRQYIPDNVVAPVAWGTFQKDKSKSFFLTNFRYLVERLPPTPDLLVIVKKHHQSSTSPNGKFGFPVKTFYGPRLWTILGPTVGKNTTLANSVQV
jgi:protein-ribulosamine 3-kinase